MWAGFQPVSMRKFSSSEPAVEFDRDDADFAADGCDGPALAVEPLE